MGENGTVWLPEAASTIAPEVDALFYFVYWTSAVIFVGVVASIIYFAIKYRRRDATHVPARVKENHLVETISIVIPTILVLIVFTWGFKVFVKLYAAPPDSYEITVRAKQWFWEFEYDNGVVVANDLHVPIGRPIKLNMSSEDVIHSFFVPEFRIKHDVLPNRYTSVWFEVDNEGEFTIFCTEYCGTSHAAMLGNLVVEPEPDFQRWLASQNADRPPEELGQELFSQYTCNACHSTDGTPGVGPSLQGIFGSSRGLADGSSVTADENYLRESILDPTAKVAEGFNPIMPGSYSSLTAKQVDGLIAYIKTLQ